MWRGALAVRIDSVIEPEYTKYRVPFREALTKAGVHFRRRGLYPPIEPPKLALMPLLNLKLIGLVTLCVFCTPLLQAAGKPKVHTINFGGAKRVPYSLAGDPSGNNGEEKDLKIRPLLVDDKVKEWTTGEAHDVTDRSVAVRRAIRLNDALPADKGEHWVWQRGPWLLIDRSNGHVVALKLPDFDPSVSNVAWFRDYAAYCGTLGGRETALCRGRANCGQEAGAHEKDLSLGSG